MSSGTRRIKFIPSSLRLRLTLWYVAVLGVILLAFAVALYQAIQINQARELDSGLAATAEIVASRLGGRITFSSLDLFEPDEFPVREEVFYQVVLLSGQVLLRSENLSGAALPLGEDAQRAALQGGGRIEDVAWQGAQLRLSTQPYRFLGNGPVVGWLQVAVPLRGVQETMRQLRFWLWIIVPLTLAVTSLGGVFLADRLLKPLSHMNAGAREISSRNLNRRLPVAKPDDELGRLATTLNDLFDRLERSFRNQQRFIGDASHELRTPLAAMRAELEVALRRGRSPEEYRDALESALDETQRLSRMAERLLFLAQSDAGELPVQWGDVGLDAVGRRVIDKLGTLAGEKGLHLALEELGPAATRGDPELLEQLAFILVENAVKYTPEGGRVRLASGADDDGAWLEVVDTGPGIPEAHLPHLFERFYRVDKARSRALGGTGLGLSIAHSIALAHGGAIDVDSRPNAGTRFRVTLPRRANAPTPPSPAQSAFSRD